MTSLAVTPIHELPLRCQVVETDVFGARWVIAAFDLKEDAETFAGFKRACAPDSTFEVRVPAEFRPTTDGARELVRAPEVTERLAEVDV